jgi:hypothetical protein
VNVNIDHRRNIGAGVLRQALDRGGGKHSEEGKQKSKLLNVEIHYHSWIGNLHWDVDGPANGELAFEHKTTS